MRPNIKPKEQKILAQAQACLSQNNASEAQQILTKYLAKNKKISDQGNFFLCISYAMGGSPEKAINIALQLHKKHPKEIEYIKLAGNCYHELKRYDEAVMYFQMAEKINSSDFQVLSNLASSLREANRLEDAEKTFKKSLTINPNQPDALSNYGLLELTRHNLDEAIALQKKALSLSPNHPGALYNIAFAYKLKGNLTLALGSYQKLLSLIPNHLAALIDTAQIYGQNKQFDQALILLKHADKLSPGNIDVLNNIAISYKTQNQNTEAEEYFRKVLSINPEHKTAKYYIAMLQGEQSFSKPPEEYVEGLFDEYAENFDEHLVSKLKYITPSLIKDEVEKHISHSRKYHILDLGCGTGLSGEVLQQFSDKITGIDLSSKMIDKAREKNIYSELHVSDIETYLESINTDTTPDIVVSADVFVYIGDLSSIFKLLSQKLNKDALFVFSTETSNGAQDFELRNSGRFAHTPEYIERLSKEHNFNMLNATESTIRYDLEKPITGHIYTLAKV